MACAEPVALPPLSFDIVPSDIPPPAEFAILEPEDDDPLVVVPAEAPPAAPTVCAITGTDNVRRVAAVK